MGSAPHALFASLDLVALGLGTGYVVGNSMQNSQNAQAQTQDQLQQQQQQLEQQRQQIEQLKQQQQTE
jgi:uncharacterized membrane-anchored protein YhcB (DUF1043 family)